MLPWSDCCLLTPGQKLSDEPSAALNARGYCVVPLSLADFEAYAAFHSDVLAFFGLSKQDKDSWGPHRLRAPLCAAPLHGYSRESGLKERYQLRAWGPDGPALPTPSLLLRHGLVLAARLDTLSRQLCAEAAGAAEGVAALLDPLAAAGTLPAHYVSSSALESLHYWGAGSSSDLRAVALSDDSTAPTTDASLVTVVVCSDTPGLEVYDAVLGGWVQVERLLHEYCAQHSTPLKGNALSHRRFAVVLFGDAVHHLRAGARGCPHRLGAAESMKARYAVHYKCCVAPLATQVAPDTHALAMTQYEAGRALRPDWKSPAVAPEATASSRWWLYVGVVAMVTGAVALWWKNKGVKE